MVSFNTTVWQITKMFQWPKRLDKNWWQCFSQKKNRFRV